MEVKRTELEVFNAKKRYYDNLDDNEGDSNFWKIFITLCVLLVSIILLVTCYRYIYGKIIYFGKRCFTWRNEKNNVDDNFFVIKTESKCCTKRRWPSRSNSMKFHVKCNDEKDKLNESVSYKSETSLQEKEKLLASRENKNLDLAKQLFLKLSFLSPYANNGATCNRTSNTWNVQNVKQCTSDEPSTRRTENSYKNSRKDERNIFSDTDLKCLVIPIPSKKSNVIDEQKEILLCKWNSGNVNYDCNIRNATSSKLIEFQFQSNESFNAYMRKHGVSATKSTHLPGSITSRSLITDSKYFSDSAANGSEILPNLFVKNLKRKHLYRSTNSLTNSTISTASIRTKIMKSEASFMCIAHEITASEPEELEEIKVQIRSDECNTHPTLRKKKVKSSADISNSRKEETKNCRNKIRSEENCTVFSIENENARNHRASEKDFTFAAEQIAYHIDSSVTPLNHSSDKSEIYDELGILFSQCMKLQIRPCRRKYCFRSRRLNREPHSTRKCQMRFNCHQAYPYDQRPTCNSGNVCVDTYDELKLMSTLPSEHKNIYQQMFTRRKQFLNQPCLLTNQDLMNN